MFDCSSYIHICVGFMCVGLALFCFLWALSVMVSLLCERALVCVFMLVGSALWCLLLLSVFVFVCLYLLVIFQVCCCIC